MSQLTEDDLIPEGRYNWKHDPHTKLIFMEKYRYGGDSRIWYKFAKANEPNEGWCEVLSQDLHMLEKTK